MWLFGYGALMWDGWETRFGCLQRKPALAPNHARIFNKKSLERWGTHARPGLTLNLTPSGTCHGVAFEFDDAAEVETYLCERETCTATDIEVQLPEKTVGARAYIYDGPRLVADDLPLQGAAAMVLAAEGNVGSGYDYVKGVRRHLRDLGVDDPAVETLWQAIVSLREGRDD